MDSNTTSGANVSTGSRIRYLRHPTLLLTRAADEERNLWSSSSRHPGAAVARKTRAIGRELLRAVMTLLLDAGVPQCPLFGSTRVGACRLLAQSGHGNHAQQCPLLGVKRTSTIRLAADEACR